MGMGIFRGMAKAGIAKKAFDMARRPENQAKVRQAVDRLRQKGKGSSGSSHKAH